MSNDPHSEHGKQRGIRDEETEMKKWRDEIQGKKKG